MLQQPSGDLATWERVFSVFGINPVEPVSVVGQSKPKPDFAYQLEAVGFAAAVPWRMAPAVCQSNQVVGVHRKFSWESSGNGPTSSRVSVRLGKFDDTLSIDERNRSSIVVSLSDAPMPM